MKSNHVRVRRKGQVTLPNSLRRAFKIEEGSVLEAEASAEGILLRPLPAVEGGKVVGKDAYREVIGELDELRKRWR